MSRCDRKGLAALIRQQLNITSWTLRRAPNLLDGTHGHHVGEPC